MASRKSQEHSHAESLAMSAATAIVEDETRQGSPPSLSNRSKKEESLEKLDYGANLRHWGQPNAAPASSNIWANSDDSDAHWYGTSNNTHSSKTNTNTANLITNSMGNLSLSSKDYGKDGKRGGGNTSVASATSSIPGIVGISSGSTGGNTAHSSWNDATSYSQYSMTHQQQQRQQPLHIPSVPPGFLSPLVASKNDDESSTSRSFTHRQSKKQNFKRKGQRKGRHGQSNYNYNNNNNNRNQNYSRHQNNRRGKNNDHHQSVAVFEDSDSYSNSTYSDSRRTTASSKASSEES